MCMLISCRYYVGARNVGVGRGSMRSASTVSGPLLSVSTPVSQQNRFAAVHLLTGQLLYFIVEVSVKRKSRTEDDAVGRELFKNKRKNMEREDRENVFSKIYFVQILLCLRIFTVMFIILCVLYIIIYVYITWAIQKYSCYKNAGIRDCIDHHRFYNTNFRSVGIILLLYILHET